MSTKELFNEMCDAEIDSVLDRTKEIMGQLPSWEGGYAASVFSAIKTLQHQDLIKQMEIITLQSDNEKLMMKIMPEHRVRQFFGVIKGTHEIVEKK